MQLRFLIKEERILFLIKLLVQVGHLRLKVSAGMLKCKIDICSVHRDVRILILEVRDVKETIVRFDTHLKLEPTRYYSISAQ